MEIYVLDTVGLVRRIENKAVGLKAKKAIEKAEAGQAEILIPSIVFAEIMYNFEKGKIAISLTDVETYLKKFSSIKEFCISLAATKAASEIDDIPELHDRLIAGAAKYLNSPLITSDRKIANSKWIATIW
jgi:predicted nucleic acid-binding protein